MRAKCGWEYMGEGLFNKRGFCVTGEVFNEVVDVILDRMDDVNWVLRSDVDAFTLKLALANSSINQLRLIQSPKN